MASSSCLFRQTLFGVVLSLVLAGIPLGQVKLGRLSENEKLDALRRHNFHRCNVSPKASFMPRLTWDEDLAQIAQAYADTCPETHNINRKQDYKALTGKDEEIGENYGRGFALLNDIVDAFASERDIYDYNLTSCPGRSWHDCAHYTQVVWANTLFVGCARSTNVCPRRLPSYGIYMCNYRSAGNIVGEKPYPLAANDCTITDACASLPGGPTPTAPIVVPTYTRLVKGQGRQLKARASSYQFSRDQPHMYAPANVLDGVSRGSRGWRPSPGLSSKIGEWLEVRVQSGVLLGKVDVVFASFSVPKYFTFSALASDGTVTASITFKKKPHVRKYSTTFNPPVIGAVGARITLNVEDFVEIAEFNLWSASAPVPNQCP